MWNPRKKNPHLVNNGMAMRHQRTSSEKTYPLFKLISGFWMAVSGILGALQISQNPHAMNSDGLHYMDMGRAMVSLDWNVAINGYRSPLYSLFLGLAEALFDPGLNFMLILVQLVNGAVFIFSIAAFHIFVKNIRRSSKENLAAERVLVPDWLWVSMAWALFIWSSIKAIRVTTVTPDLLVSGFYYVILAVIIRILSGRQVWQEYFRLGLLLGAAYLAKAPMFLLALMIFTMLGILAITRYLHVSWFSLLGGFLILAGPWMLLLSIDKGSITFGESGSLNYAWFVNGVPNDLHWRGGPEGNGVPVHPTEQLSSNPAVYAYPEPVGGTYPAGYDPPYWYEGLKVRFDLGKQIDVIDWNLRQFIWFAWPVIALGLIWIIMVLLYDDWRRIAFCDLLWISVLPGVFMISLYLMVHIESRFSGGMLAVMGSGPFLLIRDTRHRKNGGSLLLLMLLVIPVLSWLFTSTPFFISFPPQRPGYVETAAVLEDDFPEARKFGVIGNAGNAFWARLINAQVVAEIPKDETSAFLEISPEERLARMEAFRDAGVDAVVSPAIPQSLLNEGWMQLGDRQIYIYIFEGH